MNQFSAFDDLPPTPKMPALFIGHGSPMNGIENNTFSRTWQEMGKTIPRPAAVIVVSAHWETRGTNITAMDFPATIHDFYGFPGELEQVEYPAPGNSSLASETAKLVTGCSIGLSHDWGLDHGAWTVLRHMYPDADIPVLQLSLDTLKSPKEHYEMAIELRALRNKGVLIVGSGNMVHNLRMVDFRRLNERFGFDWALQINEIFKRKILEGDHAALAKYAGLGKEALLAIPSEEHYLPLLYVLALREKNEPISFFNDYPVAGSLTMTSVRIG